MHCMRETGFSSTFFGRREPFVTIIIRVREPMATGLSKFGRAVDAYYLLTRMYIGTNIRCLHVYTDIQAHTNIHIARERSSGTSV